MLEREAERFELFAWNYGAYGEYRDMSLDQAGIDRLLAAPEPSEDDIVDIRRLARRTSRIAHIAGDRYPFLGRLFAAGPLRESLSDARGYLRDIRGLAGEIRSAFKQRLRVCQDAGERIIVIGHSLGSVIAYDAFWELSHEDDASITVDTFVTLGSPLATHFVSELIKGRDRMGRERYPTIMRRWVNFSAIGETVALFPPLGEFFSEMLELGLIDSIDDRTDLLNHFRGSQGLNVHVSYGFLVNTAVANVIGDRLIA